MDQYDHHSGLDIDIKDNSTFADLLVHLKLQPEGIGMMFMDDRPANKTTRLKNSGKIRIFQPIFGG